MKILIDDKVGIANSLNANEACVYAAIAKYTQGKGWYAGCEALAAALPFVMSRSTVSRAVDKLKRMGLLDEKDKALFCVQNEQDGVQNEQEGVQNERNRVQNEQDCVQFALPPNNPHIKENIKERINQKEEEMKELDKFWNLFSPAAEYANRQHACEQRWNQMTDFAHRCIFREFEIYGREEVVKRQPNPLFYLMNWRPPRPRFLTQGAELHAALEAGYKTALVHVPEDYPEYREGRHFAWMTLQDAQFFGFKIKQMMEKVTNE